MDADVHTQVHCMVKQLTSNYALCYVVGKSILTLYQGGKRKRPMWLWKKVDCWYIDSRSLSHNYCSTGWCSNKDSDFSDICIAVRRDKWMRKELCSLYENNVIVIIVRSLNSMKTSTLIDLHTMIMLPPLDRDKYKCNEWQARNHQWLKTGTDVICH